MIRIANVQVENFKGVKFVEITPKDDLVVISGNNGQGKSSILDAIYGALYGTKTMDSQPIRHGENEATIRLDLGEILVERVIKEGKPQKLTVTSKEGSKFDTPQKMLDSLLGAITFDPLEFARFDAKTQVKSLKELLNLDFSTIDADRQKIYEDRTLTNRQAKDLESQLKEINFNEDAPTTQQDASDLAKQLADAQRSKQDLLTDERNLDRVSSEIERKEEQLKQLEKELSILSKEHVELSKSVEEKKKLATDDSVIEKLNADMKNIESINAKVLENTRYLEKKKQVEEYKAKSEALTKTLEEKDNEKSDLLKAVEMPLPELSFTDEGVLYNNIPLAQCSTAEQLKISVAIAMKLNPQVRVLRMKEGSMLDSNTMQWLKDLAKEKDYQVWIERVGAEPMTIVIEDGLVVR
jgi:DNA repair exonuclease SbcCD ATPase subunit